MIIVNMNSIFNSTTLFSVPFK